MNKPPFNKYFTWHEKFHFILLFHMFIVILTCDEIEEYFIYEYCTFFVISVNCTNIFLDNRFNISIALLNYQSTDFS